MKTLRVLVGVLVAVVLSGGCQGNNPVLERLADIETFAVSYPDSARLALEAIDPALLNTKGLMARHALMLSTALNRCGVKATNDSLINIAVDYYARFGPKKEKFLAYYYQGQVYWDQRNYEAALSAYLQAESVRHKDIPLRHLTALYLKKGDIYRQYYDYEKSIDAYRKAQKYALLCDWPANYYSALLGELSQYIVFENTECADSLMDFLAPHRAEMTLRNRASFDNLLILLLIQKDTSQDSLLSVVHAYENEYSSLGDFPWPTLSLFYSRAGDFANAEMALVHYSHSAEFSDADTRYLKASSLLLDSLGRKQDSQKAAMELSTILGQEVFQKNTSDLRFMEERIHHEIQKQRQGTAITIGLIIVFILYAIALWFLRKRRRQKETLEITYSSLKEEYEELSALIKAQSGIQEEARALLGERIKSLAQFLSINKPASLDKVADQIESLTENRKQLLETIGLLYAVYHPTFVQHLQASGLTNGEIGYCSLLILGFRTGEIGDVINRSSTYHISSAIRQKVGLGPNDTNLSIYLKNLFKETEA